MSLLRTLLAPGAKRSVWPTTLTIDDVVNQYWSFNTGQYTLNQTLTQPREDIIANYGGLIAAAYRSNPIVFAVEQKRLQLFSEARFQFQQMRGGRPGDLFGTPELQILERPESGETTQDLLTRILVSADFGGDAFIVRRPGRLVVLRPDWTTMILGSREASIDPNDVDVELIGLSYQEGGPMRGRDPIFFARGEFAHYAPVKDPLARYRGMPWLLPIIREIQGDSAATMHKLKFFENGATPNMIVTLNPALTIEKAREWIELFEQDHNGVFNAYRTVYMGGGSSSEVVGKDLQQVDFKATQGAGETRIASAGGIHPTIVGLSEGLQGSSLNAGNFGAARRLVADATLRPLWGNLAGSLETIINVPGGSRLWYDDRHIPFLADDIKDRAEVQSLQSASINILTTAGYEPTSIIDAITSEDWRRLQHNGLFSVQLQPPGTSEPAVEEAPALLASINGRSLPLLTAGSVEMIRCPACNKLAGELVTAPYRFTCTNPKCRTVIESGMARTEPVIDTAPLVAVLERMRPSDVSVTIERGAIQMSNPITVQPSPVTIAEGAIQVEVNAPPMTMEQGAIQVDVSSPVTVEPSPVTISEGALQVHSPVTIERGAVEVGPSPITIAEGAVQVEVHAPPMTIERGAVQVDVSNPVTVEPTSVTIEEGAVQVTTPDVRIDAPIRVEPTSVTIEEGAIQASIEPATVTFADQAIQVSNQVPMRTIIDRDPETNEIRGSHEEPV